MRLDDESGVAGVEALAFGVLIFLVGTLLVVNAWGVVDAKMAASSSAREAIRVLVESGAGISTEAVAEQIVVATIAGHGKDPAGIQSVTVDGVLARCERLRATVVYQVPTITLPWVGGFGSGGMEVTGSHTEIVDPFRSGLPGEADCGF